MKRSTNIEHLGARRSGRNLGGEVRGSADVGALDARDKASPKSTSSAATTTASTAATATAASVVEGSSAVDSAPYPREAAAQAAPVEERSKKAKASRASVNGPAVPPAELPGLYTITFDGLPV